MFRSSYPFVLFLLTAVSAKNDWTKPCLQGLCSYDLPESAKASGTLQIRGASHAISDITTAANWMIIDCDPNATEQSIRMVCNGDVNSTSCGHLFKTTSPEGKLVRLPESCGKGPFARVAKAHISEDQSIPPSIASRLVRRSGVQPQVHSLHLDTNFAAIDSSKSGHVLMSIVGSNIPGVNFTTPRGPHRRSRFTNRDFFGDLVGGLDSGIGVIGGSGAASAASAAASSVSSEISNVGNIVGNGINSANNINVNKTSTLPPLVINKNIPIINDSIQCNGQTLALEADLDTNTNMAVSVGVVASGTLVPPVVSDFSVVLGLDGTINGTLNLRTDVNGSISSGPIPIFQVGIPGIDFPGIFTLGPTFSVNAEATANLDVQAALRIGFSHTSKNAQLFFPPSSNTHSAANFAPADTPLTIVVTPNIKAAGSLTAHLIPTISFGINAFNGVASAQVFTDLDASVTLGLSPSTIKPTRKRADVSAPAVFNGCVDTTAALDVNIGASANFFKVFGPSTKATLFSKNFNIFQKCFGTAAPKKRALYNHQPRSSHLRSPALSKRADLTCPLEGLVNSAVNTLINAIVPGANIVAI